MRDISTVKRGRCPGCGQAVTWNEILIRRRRGSAAILTPSGRWPRPDRLVLPMESTVIVHDHLLGEGTGDALVDAWRPCTQFARPRPARWLNWLLIGACQTPRPPLAATDRRTAIGLTDGQPCRTSRLRWQFGCARKGTGSQPTIEPAKIVLDPLTFPPRWLVRWPRRSKPPSRIVCSARFVVAHQSGHRRPRRLHRGPMQGTPSRPRGVRTTHTNRRPRPVAPRPFRGPRPIRPARR